MFWGLRFDICGRWKGSIIVWKERVIVVRNVWRKLKFLFWVIYGSFFMWIVVKKKKNLYWMVEVLYIDVILK